MSIKRCFDIAASGSALVLLSPVLVVSAAAIKLASPGPVLYRGRRVGRNGRPFTMHKFRTMHVRQVGGSVITSPADKRVFPVGALLRKLKIDELPQLWDVLRGEMSIVGPRPEDPAIVDGHYTDWMRETLSVRPGLASPGSLFGTTHGDRYLNDLDPEGSYVRNLLPIKLAVEMVYVRRSSLAYDLEIVARTIVLIVRSLAGTRDFREPREVGPARLLLSQMSPLEGTDHCAAHESGINAADRSSAVSC